MKLKYVTFILLLLNATLLAWQWEAFARWGWGPQQHREPERLQQQIRPEALRFDVMTPQPAASLAQPQASAPASDAPALAQAASDAPAAAASDSPAASGAGASTARPSIPNR